VEGLVVPVDELGEAEDPAEEAPGAGEKSAPDTEAVAGRLTMLLDHGGPQTRLVDGTASADPDRLGLIGDGAVEELGVETGAD
jgi:hypothetical protein